jgi:hypothetical protein
LHASSSRRQLSTEALSNPAHKQLRSNIFTETAALTVSTVLSQQQSRNAIPEEGVVSCAAVLIHQTQTLQAALLQADAAQHNTAQHGTTYQHVLTGSNLLFLPHQ